MSCCYPYVNHIGKVLPRLVEFEEGQLYAYDFKRTSFKYLDIIGEDACKSFSHCQGCYFKWVNEDNEKVTLGDVKDTAYELCGKDHAFLRLYVEDYNFSYPRFAKISKVFIYRLNYLGVKPDKRNRPHNCYEMYCLDDVKTFHSLKQLFDLDYHCNPEDYAELSKEI